MVKEMELRLPANVVKVKIDLPGHKKFWVKFYDDVSVGEFEILQEIRDLKTIREVLARYTESWNLVDSRGEELPAPYKNPEAFSRLPMRLLLWCTTALVDVCMRGLPLVETREEPSPSESSKP